MQMHTMPLPSCFKVYDCPPGVSTNQDFKVEVRPTQDYTQQWTLIPSYAIEVASANIASNDFHRYTVALASFDLIGHVRIRVTYTASPVHSAVIRPLSLGIEPELEENQITLFTLDKARDVMLELNGNKWKALHLLINSIENNSPTEDTEDLWYFAPGINQGSAYARVTDGVNLMVPSGKTVYLAGGAFITCRLNFVDVSNSAVRGHGFILGPKGGYTYREHGGAIHMSYAKNIRVEGVTSIGANGFSLSVGECHNVLIDRYRSFSYAGNGDGIDIFCSTGITIQNCFLRNSDDTIALYSHRWDWHGDSKDVVIRDCVLLPDVAHAINMGTHGNPTQPETTSNVKIRNIDILDHDENQLWYQGCIAINAADMNLFQDIHIENVRVERITRGQLFNIRVMKNEMWTTAPGRSIRNVTFKNVELMAGNSGQVNPSMILGYDVDRKVENITFENLKIGGDIIHEEIEKPRWYMVSDLVPLFANEHVQNLKFSKTR